MGHTRSPSECGSQEISVYLTNKTGRVKVESSHSTIRLESHKSQFEDPINVSSSRSVRETDHTEVYFTVQQLPE